MRKLAIFAVLLLLLLLPVHAADFDLPDAPAAAQKYMPENTESFADGLLEILMEAIFTLRPGFAEASKVCFCVTGCMLLVAAVRSITNVNQAVDLILVLAISYMLTDSTNSMIHLGADTIQQVAEYGKLLLPVLTGVLASQGGISTSAALYAGTSVFIHILIASLENLIGPLLYVYMVLCIGHHTTGEELLKSICNFLKWGTTWLIKVTIYLFTGYLSITGVVSGTTDAAALKAAKITLSGVVPVVGNIISDASEAVLVSAGVLKNSLGISGLLVIIATWIAPFLQIAAQYLLLKITCAISGLFGTSGAVGLLKDFTGIMGLILAATSTICLLMLVSIVCYIRGVT